MNKTTIVGVLVVVIAMAALLWVIFDEPAEQERPKISDRKSQISEVTPAVQKPEKASPKKVERKTPDAKSPAKKRVRRMAVAEYSPEDQKLADAVQAALDDDDFEKTRASALAALKSENPDVRQEAVDALGWFEDKALVDLTKVLADPNKDVADSARSHIETALMGMEDNDRAFALAAEYIKLYPEDEESRTMFAGVLTSTAGAIIDPEDADSAHDVAYAKGNRSSIVTIVSEMIEMGGGMAKEAKEVYENITGDAWTDRAAADAWANDIEEPTQEESES